MVLNQTNSLIEKEARECVERNASSNKKKNFTASADELIPMWIYVIINSDINHLITESSILQDFRIQGAQSELEYILITFTGAIEQLKKDLNSNNKYANIAPIHIQTKSIIIETPYEIQQRSQSMVNTKPIVRDNDGNMFTNVTSSIKNIFK